MNGRTDKQRGQKRNDVCLQEGDKKFQDIERCGSNHGDNRGHVWNHASRQLHKAFLHRVRRITVEISRPLLELRKIFDRAAGGSSGAANIRMTMDADNPDDL